MPKKTLLVLLIILLSLIGVYIYLNRDSNSTELPTDNNDNSQTENRYNFVLEKTYISQNSWEYTVTGQLPTPCHSASVSALVAESYPEQVTIQVEVTEPSGDIMCAQVVQDFKYDGTFSASEQATVKLYVK